jgi:phosphoglycolate phosphatase-like HAD superfamily hydrolase
MVAFINEFLSNSRVVIVTNGTVQQQKNKIAQFDFKSISKEVEVIYANETAPKPSIEPVRDYFVRYGRPQSNEMIFIGDHLCDMLFADNLGIRFYHRDMIKQIQALKN